MRVYLLLALIIFAAAKQIRYPRPLGNPPEPSAGCRKQFPIPTTDDHFELVWRMGIRTVRMNFPDNYDNTHPYKLMIGMQCMGGSGQAVQNEGYYGLRPLDKNKEYIFIAPEGNGQMMPWDYYDYWLFDDLLNFMKENACIDESRVFVSGFSWGAMFSTGLSYDHQNFIRAVTVFETADRNIYLPEKLHLPIGWMALEALQDPVCQPWMARGARDTILRDNGPGGSDASGEKAIEYPGWGPHVCYDYKTVDPNYPVRWCTINGEHMWDFVEDGVHWVPLEAWDFLSKF